MGNQTDYNDKLSNTLECQSCGSLLNGFTEIEKGSRPSDGDFTVCFYCGTIHTYENDLTSLKIASDEKMHLLRKEDPQLWMQIMYIQHKIINA